MSDAFQLRPAQPVDAPVAALLLYAAYTHTQGAFPPQEAPDSGFIARLERYFQLPANRFSYQYTQVAVSDAAVVGLVLSFGGRDEARLNAAVVPWLTHEAADDEWYVDAVAVFTNWGRRGIGTHLLQTAEAQVRQQGYPKIALNVAQENTQAFALYTRLGYVVTKHTTLYQRPHLRMVKVLANVGTMNS